MLKVNGIPIATPSDFSVGVQDLSQAERVATGDIVIDRIATKIKLTMKWNYLTATQLSTLLNAIEPVTFSVTYLDPRSNSQQSRMFYVGDRNAGMYRYNNGNPEYVDIGFNFIEV